MNRRSFLLLGLMGMLALVDASASAATNAVARTNGSDAVDVKTIQVDGVTVLDVATVTMITANYQGRLLDAGELLRLRDQLTQAYVEAGYITSGVVVPTQQLHDGVLRLQAIEGHVLDPNITTGGALDPDYARHRLNDAFEGAFNIAKMSELTALLQQDPRIERVDARISPTSQRGVARVDVRIDESPRWQIEVGADNYRSESVGGETASLAISTLNLSGRGDELELAYGFSEGSDSGRMGYRFFLPSSLHSLRLYAERAESAIVEAPFDQLDVESIADTFGVLLAWQGSRDQSNDYSLEAGFEWRRAKTELLGERFSFTPGADRGQTDVRVLLAGGQWMHRASDQVIAARVRVRVGLDIWGASEATPLGSTRVGGDFASVAGQTQWIRRFDEQWSLQLQAIGQFAFDPLLSLEKIAVGGHDSVRGYRENALLADHGAYINLELRYQVDSAPLKSVGGDDLQAVLFVDQGWSWDDADTTGNAPARDTTDVARVTSVGAGLRFRWFERLQGAIFYGHDASKDFPGGAPRSARDQGLQDDGIHAHLSYRWNF